MDGDRPYEHGEYKKNGTRLGLFRFTISGFMKFHTWLITVSTKEDLDATASAAIADYFKKKCRYGYVVLEHASDTLRLHLHASVCFKQPAAKKDFEATLWKHIFPVHPTAIKRIAVKSTVQYNDKWIQEYLQKDSTKQVLWHVMGDDYASFYPSKEEQEALKASKTVGKMLPGDSKDPWFAKHEIDWEEHSPDDSSYESAIVYLKYKMNVERSMPVIKDRRRLREAAWALHEYRTHSVAVTAADLNFMHQETGGGHNYSV